MKRLFVFIVLFAEIVGQMEKPKFRIVAPQFICPKDEEAVIAKADETVITVQSGSGPNVTMEWQVRWTPLVAPTQRFTLMVWRAVRTLELELNKPQPVPLTYVIDNTELLKGLDYVFTATAISASGARSDPKVFHIDNSQGASTLNNIDGRGDLLSINLLGSDIAYPDVDYVIEAQITVCYPTQDYHMLWTVKSINGEHHVDVTEAQGCRLTVPATTLQVDLTYEAQCQVIKSSNMALITQTGMMFQVAQRPSEVYTSIDHLLVSVGAPFSIETLVFNHNHPDEKPTLFEWSCSFESNPCDFFDSVDSDVLTMEFGVPQVGEYVFSVKVNFKDESVTAKTSVTGVEARLPTIQLAPVSRVSNAFSTISLTANASEVVPSCSLTWYFASHELLKQSTDENEHGEPLAESLTIYSLEENFLIELSDFSNETEWRQITADMQAKAGRARFVAECGCSKAKCEGNGTVYADLFLELNESPTPKLVMIKPVSGTALESLFRISTQAAVDPDIPLKYSFYCRLGDNHTLLLDFFYEYLSVETFLPYIEGGTQVWVEVCDNKGACNNSPSVTVSLTKASADIVHLFIDTARGQLRRCEVRYLTRTTIAAIVTYTNQGMQDPLNLFTSSLKDMLSSGEAKHCQSYKNDQFDDFILALESVGISYDM